MAHRPGIRGAHGIWVDVVTGGTNELLSRIAQEAEAPAADVMFGGGVDSLEVYGDCFEPYVCVQQEAIAERYRSEDGLWTPFSALPVVLIYNTKLLSPGEVADWADLLQPEFQGKIAFTDPGVSGSCFTGLVTLLQAVGGDRDETLRQFARQLEGRELDSSGDILAAVSSGSCWVGVTLEESAWETGAGGGQHRGGLPPGRTSSVPDGSALIRGAVHPDNAKRFLDFTVSQEVQQLLSDQYRRPVREDVGTNPALPGLSEVVLVDYDLAWASENHDAILMSWAFYQGGGGGAMRRLLSASFRNRLFAALLAAPPLIPLLLCSALLLQIFRLRMEDRAQGEADGYLDSVGQTLDQACRSFSSAAAALERDGVLSQALLQGSPSQGEVYRLFLEDVQSAQTLARLDLYDSQGNWYCSTRSAAGRSLSPQWGVLYQARERAGP